MKRLQRFLAIVMGAILFTAGIAYLPSQLSFTAQSISPPIQQAQGISSPINDSDTSAPSEPVDDLALFLEADQLYRQGDTIAAEEIYRQVKPEFKKIELREIPEPIYEEELLEAETLALWNQAKPYVEKEKEDEAIPILKKIVEQEPGFIPGQIALAQMLEEEGDEKEAFALLDELATLYPDSAEVIMALVVMFSEESKHLEAAIAAREFSILYLDHPQAEEFKKLAEEELEKFTRSRKRRSVLGGIAGTAASVLLGGKSVESQVVDAIKIAQLMLTDEAEMGAKLAEEYKKKLSLVEDPEIMDYVKQLGLQMSQSMGRDFDYEFYVVRDSSINAFALPGGKIFVNTGAILATHSQAELAGLLAHEAAHSVLSHGLQGVFINNFLKQFTGEIKLVDFALGLISLKHNRNQERAADILGTRVLATGGYAADGLRNLMVTMGENSDPENTKIEYLSTHPASDSRVRYLEELIQRNGYNRYALEGVDKHSDIQKQLRS